MENKNKTSQELADVSIHDLRVMLRECGGVPGAKNKTVLISEIMEFQDGTAVVKPRSTRGRKPLDLKGDKKLIIDNSASNCEGRNLGEKLKIATEKCGYIKMIIDGANKIYGGKPDKFFKNRGIVKDSGSEIEKKVVVKGILDIGKEGYGFLRRENFSSREDDIYVPDVAIDIYHLRHGDLVVCESSPIPETKNYALIGVLMVNEKNLDQVDDRQNFDSLTATYPNEIIRFKSESQKWLKDLNAFCPIGKGQRSLIIGAKNSGKTYLLKTIAKMLSKEQTGCELIFVVIDGRPEDVGEISSCCKQVAFTIAGDEDEKQVDVAQLALGRAKRISEDGGDVVLLIDDLQNLAKAYADGYNQTAQEQIKEIVKKIKSYLGCARNLIDGGSLTIIAALDMDGSEISTSVYEGVSELVNNQICLESQKDKRKFIPKINLEKSYTSRDHLLLDDDDYSYREKVLSLKGDL